MLKPQDIMIGDWLLADGKVIQVAAVHLKKVGYHERHDRLTWVRLDRLEYIIITPETLAAFGFVKSKTDAEAWSTDGEDTDEYYWLVVLLKESGAWCDLDAGGDINTTFLPHGAISDLQHFYYETMHGKVMPIKPIKGKEN